MKKRIFKIALSAILVVATVLSFASCGTAKVADADDAEGKIDGTDISWEYSADDKLLSIEGTGAIPDFESSESVAWYAVRHSVEEIEIAEGITAIGDHAFYFCPELEDISIPESVTSVGKLAFAFCSSLTGIDLPSALTSIGEGAFEACIKLKGINVPSTVTSVGARAFAHCSSLEDVVITGSISEIASWTFMGCTSLETLLLNDSSRDIPVAEDAFESAAIGIEKASYTASTTGKVTLTVKYVYEDGSEARPAWTEEHEVGDNYSVESYLIENYKASEAAVSGVITGDETLEVVYTPTGAVTEAETEAETEPEVEPEPEKPKTKVGIIIAIVIFAVVIVGIIVLAIIMIRSDKKQATGKGAKNAKNSKNGKRK